MIARARQGPAIVVAGGAETTCRALSLRLPRSLHPEPSSLGAMRTRRLGNSDLAGDGRRSRLQQLRRPDRRAGARRQSSTPLSTPGSRSSTPRTPTAAAAAARRFSAGSSRGDATRSFSRRSSARPGRRRDRARVAHLHPEGDRGIAPPAADRPDRPLPVPPPGRRDADRGDARRARRAGQGGQGACDRLVELHCVDGRGSPRGCRGRRADAVRVRAEPVLLAAARCRARSCCRPASGSASASSPTFRSPAAC